MKRRLLPTLIFTLVLFSSMIQSCSVLDHRAPEPANTQAQLQQLTDSIFTLYSTKWDIRQGGIFMRVMNPSGSYLVSSNITPLVQDNTHFRVASISKTFTAAAIMRLKQEGKLALDDTITKYLPNTPAYNIPNKEKITIKLLLQHRAGVFDVTNQNIPDTVKQDYARKRYSDYITEPAPVGLNDPNHTFTYDELFGVISQNRLANHLPNAQFYYSNSGYQLLAKIVEGLTNMSFNEYITKTFIEPLKLTNTYGVVLGTDQRIRAPFIESFLHVFPPGSSRVVINSTVSNMSNAVADGHIVSTPADISRWMELLISGQAGLSAATVEEMKKMLPGDAGNERYGLGLTFDEGLGFGHDGFKPSYLSRLRYDPNTKTTVLVVATFIYVKDPEEKQPGPDFLELAYGLRDMGRQGAQIINR
ncbi:class A beta-lactamase-related serine hydrolase [Fibrisoma montanum]|uniref:Class A beta-lactamase-related serine hydrolase n=1 Tax=Fibrisoma montanum TaxID=2305895 RepID=A0A418M3T3_9BACT|nr:serine hydrolase domain-containing protein [Fibrisoma montanum]RIV20477.1 class A beta-lactamase-related serine hydrolase [Fibrisoma montanum]